MTCERCHGLMISERIGDLQGLSSDVVDATILEHRRRSIRAVEPLPNLSTRTPKLAAA